MYAHEGGELEDKLIPSLCGFLGRELPQGTQATLSTNLLVYLRYYIEECSFTPADRTLMRFHFISPLIVKTLNLITHTHGFILADPAPFNLSHREK